MRAFFALLIGVCASVLFFLSDVTRMQGIAQHIEGGIFSFLYDKELQFSGLQILKEEDIKAALPMERSIFWWRANTRTLESLISTSPLVERAVVKPCSSLSRGCYSIDVLEREPVMVAAIGHKSWLIGQDGGFITPIPQRDLATSNKPLVRGVLLDNLSPEIVKGRLYYVWRAIGILKQESGLDVAEIELNKAGELNVQFAKLNFPTTFDSPSIEEGEENFDRLRDEARRFSRLLEEVSKSDKVIKQVDLAFNKVAVVKFEPEKPVSSSKNKKSK